MSTSPPDLRNDNWDPAIETHEQWRRRQVLEGQRYRRSQLRRIDYYVSEDAAKLIDGLRRPYVGGDYSSIIDRIAVFRRARAVLPLATTRTWWYS